MRKDRSNEKDLNSPKLEHVLSHWTQYLTECAPKTTWKLHEQVRQRREAYADAWNYSFFKSIVFYRRTKWEHVPTTSKMKTNRREYVVDSDTSLLMMGTNALTVEARKTTRSTAHSMQIANDIVEATRETEVHINELDVYVYIKSIEDSSATLSLRRLCNERSYSYTCDTREYPQST